MANQVICDLCGKPLKHNDIEQYKYKIKKRWWLWEESGWSYIDVHESCRQKLFRAIEEFKPHSGSSDKKIDKN